MIPQDLDYLFPQAAYAFFFTFLFFWLALSLFNYRQKFLTSFTNISLLKQMVYPRSSLLYWLKMAAFILAWIFCLIALMQPQGNAHYPKETINPVAAKSEILGKQRKKSHDVILLIDTSASMNVQDGEVTKSRLVFAQELADQLISHLTGERVSLIAFNSGIVSLSPATTDYLFVRLLLKQIKINEGERSGTNFFNLLTALQEKFAQAVPSTLKTFILLSDGGDTSIESLEAAHKTKKIASLVTLLAPLEKINSQIFTVGIGSSMGGEIPQIIYQGKAVVSHLQEELMRALAKEGKGHYFSAYNDSQIDLSQTLAQLIKQGTSEVEESASLTVLKATNKKIFDLYYQLPLGLALLLLAFSFLWPDTVVKNNFHQSKGKSKK